MKRKAGIAPAPISCQSGFEGKRTDGIQLPMKGAMSHAIKELISSIPILIPSETTPNRVHVPITKMASSSAVSPGNRERAITP